MIKKPIGYDEAQEYGEFGKLDLGGHICKILQAKVESYDWGSVLILLFDIHEGSKADGFYKRNFDSQGENKKWKGTFRQNISVENPTEDKELKTLRGFKTLINAIEKSNSGYKWNWDEQTLKGKLFGGVFGRKEYEFDGKSGFYTTCRFVKTVDAIKAGVEVPEDWLLQKKNSSFSVTGLDEDFHLMADDDDIPF